MSPAGPSVLNRYWIDGPSLLECTGSDRSSFYWTAHSLHCHVLLLLAVVELQRTEVTQNCWFTGSAERDSKENSNKWLLINCEHHKAAHLCQQPIIRAGEWSAMMKSCSSIRKIFLLPLQLPDSVLSTKSGWYFLKFKTNILNRNVVL